MKRELTPQEKKLLSYAKDGRNTFAESRGIARKAIARRKVKANRALRHAESQVLGTAAPDADPDVFVGRTGRRSWKKHPDAPLGEYVAARLGVRPSVVEWSPTAVAGCDLLVSTLPAGVADRFSPYVADVPALLDVVYDPWPTPLAAACGGVVVAGSAMLLHQAAAQVELMTGQPAPLAAMRTALKRTA